MFEVYMEARARIIADNDGSFVSNCNTPDPDADPPALTFHEKFMEDIVAAYVSSFEDTFDECAIEEIL